MLKSNESSATYFHSIIMNLHFIYDITSKIYFATTDLTRKTSVFGTYNSFAFLGKKTF